MVAVAILAAGRGTRMKSDLPKVLHTLAGRSLVERVLDSCSLLDLDRQIVIVGYHAEQVKQALSHRPEVEFVEQTQQLGTGHAVQQVMSVLAGYQGDLLVLMVTHPYCVQKLYKSWWKLIKEIKMLPHY